MNEDVNNDRTIACRKVAVVRCSTMENLLPQPADAGRSVAEKMLIDTLIGVHIVNIYVAAWERETFNNADFVYELSDGRHVRIPDFYLSVTHIETCTLEARHHPVSNEWRRQYHPNLFGHSIVDVLIQRDPEIRAADNTAIKLDSGYYLMQESGAPQGILPDVFLVEAVDPLEMQSVFETAEWLSTKASRELKATEQRLG